MSFRSLLLFFMVMVPLSASAQGYLQSLQYRPSGLNWQQLKTKHFRIIYPKNEEESAYRSARILEQQYPKASELTGGSLKNFPVILNNYNDLSNGYVTTFNFRSEVDLAPQKGKSMNPQTGSWLETVLSHELLHATHFNVQQPVDEKVPSLANLLSFLGPDIGRSIHGFAPTGVHEGLAVYHESNAITPNGGRGNYPVFTNRFNANFNSAKRWNMTQQLFPSDYTLPYNRHYLAGYTFTDWLHQEFGEDISQKTIRFHYHHFFLGYGYALRKKTGLWPGQLYALYTRQKIEEEEKRLADFPSPNTELAHKLPLPRQKGRQLHAPLWLDEQNLLLYGAFYNSRNGFYTYNIKTEDLELLQETFAAGNFHHQLQADSSLLYAGYRAHPTIQGVYRSDIRKFDLSTGTTSQLTENKRLHSPASAPEQLLAIQTQGSTEHIVEILPGGNIEVRKKFEDDTPIQLAFNPKNPDELAVVLNKRGVQALWLVSPNSLDEELENAPDLAFKNGSIHDVSWHPEDHKLLFTLDVPPAANIYEFHPQKGTLKQLTNAPFNAFEASYTPDGSRIAFILQDGDEQVPAVLGQSHFLDKTVPDSALLAGTELHEKMRRPWLGESSFDSLRAEPKPYRSGLSWLKPRILYPVVTEKANTLQTGFGFSSIDALSSQAYSAQITGIQNRLWYDVSYANKMFFPGFQVNAYSDPDFMVLGNNPNNQQFSVMRQDRGLSLSIPTEFILRGDTRLTSLSFTPEIAAEQFRFYDLHPDPLTGFKTRYRTGAFSQLNLGILTRRRDLQPTSGFGLFGMYERTLNNPDYSIRFQFPETTTTFRYEIENQWTAYYGIFGFLSPLRRFNHSLRIDLRFFQQSTPPFYSNSTIVPMGFKENPFPTYGDNGHQFQHLGRLSTRYTIPLWYPDNGFLTVPFYASSLYLTTFTHTLTNMNSKDLAGSSRTIVGGGLHLQFKISNLLLDFGLGLAIEPSRNNTQLIFGQF